MSDEQPQGRERRAYTRHDIALPIAFEVTGGSSNGTVLHGTTINISRGGVLADVGVRVPTTATCRIAFRDAEGVVSPTEVTGEVVHVGMWTHGREAIAVQFDTPLDDLQPPEIPDQRLRDR